MKIDYPYFYCLTSEYYHPQLIFWILSQLIPLKLTIPPEKMNLACRQLQTINFQESNYSSSLVFPKVSGLDITFTCPSPIQHSVFPLTEKENLLKFFFKHFPAFYAPLLLYLGFYDYQIIVSSSQLSFLSTTIFSILSLFSPIESTDLTVIPVSRDLSIGDYEQHVIVGFHSSHFLDADQIQKTTNKKFIYINADEPYFILSKNPFDDLRLKTRLCNFDRDITEFLKYSVPYFPFKLIEEEIFECIKDIFFLILKPYHMTAKALREKRTDLIDDPELKEVLTSPLTNSFFFSLNDSYIHELFFPADFDKSRLRDSMNWMRFSGPIESTPKPFKKRVSIFRR